MIKQLEVLLEMAKYIHNTPSDKKNLYTLQKIKLEQEQKKGVKIGEFFIQYKFKQEEQHIWKLN